MSNAKEENYNKFLKNIAEHKLKVNYGPLSIMAGLTNRCNLHCSFCPYCGFCYIRNSKTEYLSLDVLNILRPFFATARFFSPSSRGEPFLYPHLKELLALCRETGLLGNTHLINNATQLDHFDLKLLEGIGTIAVSFDSADKKVFELLRYGASFEHTLGNIRKLREALPNTFLQMCVVVNRLNLRHLVDVFRLARELKMNAIQFNNIYGEERDSVFQLLRLRKSDQTVYEEQMSEIEAMSQENPIQIYKTAGFDLFDDGSPLEEEQIYKGLLALKSTKPFLDYDQKKADVFSARSDNPYRGQKLLDKRLPYCISPWTTITIMPNGDICPCCSVYGPIDNINGKTAEEVWNGPAFQKFRETMFNYGEIPDYCLKCKSFMRYDFLDDCIRAMGGIENLQIPPHYFPPEYSLKNPRLIELVHSSNKDWEERVVVIDKSDKNAAAVVLAKPVNSKEYWEARFATDDWNKYGGDKQSAFFSQVAVNAFPDWLKEELGRNEWNILDVGCAQGDGSAVLARNFPSCRVTGLDFSESAVKSAQARFPYCDFIVGDATAAIDPTDVIFSSNTLEHLKNPRSILRNFCNSAKKYAVILLPFEDNLEIAEHINIFFRNFFPVLLGKCYLEYYSVIDCAPMESPYWPGKQILLVYANSKYRSPEKMTAETIYWNYTRVWEQKSKCLSARVEKQAKNIGELESAKAVSNAKIDALSKQKSVLSNLVTTLKNDKLKLNSKVSALNAEKATLLRKNSVLQRQCEQIQAESQEKTARLQTIESAVQQAREFCYALAGTRLFKFVHFISRLKRQGIHNSREERKKFRKWLSSRFYHTPDFDHRFNPIFGIIGILDGVMPDGENQDTFGGNSGSKMSQHLQLQKALFDRKLKEPETRQAKDIRKILAEREYKGILVYPHTVYWEPLQTPQHLLRAFAKDGWLCFFCEHPNRPNVFREVQPDLFIVYEADFLQAVGGTHVTVLLTWMGSLAFVEKIRNKTVWYHLMDHLEIFPYYDQKTVRLHGKSVEEADVVSYVAKPLSAYFRKDIRPIYLPNGCNPDEFLNLHEGYVPADMQDMAESGHKIIGYYGYLAEWMNYDMVRDAAQRRPDYEFVFIGKAIHDVSKIEGLPNVHLLGLKPYKELSDYAKFFDVAVIPLVINEKMDCVSPIKFYEYCALGLPVVASHMPEVETHACDFIVCVRNTEQYLSAIDRFLSPEIREKAKRQGPEIARQNTWQVRAAVIEAALGESRDAILRQPYQKFDVIILAVIDYDFRYQRPQHFAAKFAENGHRVFYVNANHFRGDSVRRIKENLFVVDFHNADSTAIHLTDWSEQPQELKCLFDGLLRRYCIRDAVVIVDYPNWLHGAEYLREQYGFKLVTDYMDDFTGFLNPANQLVRQNCVELLKTSDAVIPSSKFLYEIASKYNRNCRIVRNGGEYEHFHRAFGTGSGTGRKIVGYYGAIAEWFDAEKVCYLAEHLPDCDIVLIGEVTAGKDQFLKHANIRLTGEMPYEELPEQLAKFDVCLIPFETKTNLIKATNPVKFYEYLSAGKKIVATEIPELEPYRNKYAYLANNNEQFLRDVQLCLDGQDTLAGPEECAAFGRENDWRARYAAFASVCAEIFPKVSVIVLTYNNLELNRKCVQSILNKTAYPKYELIIVDNCSTDGTREFLQNLQAKEIPNVRVILNDENKGFAGGNNVGIRAADGDYVLLLNNDTIVTRGWITSLAKHTENSPQLGMCGPVTNSIGNEARIKVDYRELDGLDDFADRYTWQHMGKEWKDPDRLALFCTIIKREVIEKCGLLDESYKVGMFEDDDYAEAVKKAGYKLAIAEDSFVHHFEGASFKKLEDKKYRAIFEANKKVFEKKWGAKWEMPVYRPGITMHTNPEIKIMESSD